MDDDVCRDFVRSVARLVKDRERDDNGHIFDMTNDDAVDTLHSLISEARQLMGMDARPTEDDDGPNIETETAHVRPNE